MEWQLPFCSVPVEMNWACSFCFSANLFSSEDSLSHQLELENFIIPGWKDGINVGSDLTEIFSDTVHQFQGFIYVLIALL